MLRACIRAAAAASLFILLVAPAPAKDVSHRHSHGGRSRARAPVGDPAELYSRRALREARIIVQMRLYELHLQRLGCVERALTRTLSVTMPALNASQEAQRRIFACAGNPR